jgi:ATP-dependent Clp protease adapter protein ClpS
MLEWQERENEEEYCMVGNDPNTVMELWDCIFLKFFKVQGVRAQLVLLE